MRLLWISGRDLEKDLAGTTELNLCEQLYKSGCEISFLSPGSNKSDFIEHISLKTLDFPGLKTISGARDASRILGLMDLQEHDILLIDWRYVWLLRGRIGSLKSPWCIIDRGPPATSGSVGGRIRRELLANLQKIFWRRGWSLAEKSASKGFVVSTEHESIIRTYAPELDVGVIPAGCQQIDGKTSKKDPRETLSLAYIGRIDKKRGLTEILNLSKKLEENGINHTISIAGEGDMGGFFENVASKNANIVYLGRIEKKEISVLLKQQHIGLMPMPNIPVWRISSPLKLSEYLAHGLAIIGPKHPGNTLENPGLWSMLTIGPDWTDGALREIKSAIADGWGEVEKSAFLSSVGMSWEKIGRNLFEEISEVAKIH